MQFDIITIFPNMFDSFLQESLIQKTLKKGLIKINVHDLRKWTKDKHKTVDDKPFGGGPGMILMAEPIIKAVNKVKQKRKKTKVILFSPTGEQFKQKTAENFSKLNQVVMICGRYEGIDARVEKIIDEKISVGPYVLSGGELPAMLMSEAIARLLPGYMNNPESLSDESHNNDMLEYPQYTRPEEIKIAGKKISVPKVLLSGNHKEIKEWKKKSLKRI
jgi:tRNA (guanine37-N1)-methyltransferase